MSVKQILGQLEIQMDDIEQQIVRVKADAIRKILLSTNLNDVPAIVVLVKNTLNDDGEGAYATKVLEALS